MGSKKIIVSTVLVLSLLICLSVSAFAASFTTDAYLDSGNVTAYIYSVPAGNYNCTIQFNFYDASGKSLGNVIRQSSNGVLRATEYKSGWAKAKVEFYGAGNYIGSKTVSR